MAVNLVQGRVKRSFLYTFTILIYWLFRKFFFIGIPEIWRSSATAPFLPFLIQPWRSQSFSLNTYQENSFGEDTYCVCPGLIASKIDS